MGLSIRKGSPVPLFLPAISAIYSSRIALPTPHLTSLTPNLQDVSNLHVRPHNTLKPAHLTRPSTGATGYIGGDVLYALTQSFHSSKITALVRSESKASLITSKYPSVTPVIGDLDSAASITKEVADADVVLRTFNYYKTMI